MLLTKSSMSDAIGPGADWCVTPHIYENQMVFTGDNYAISQIRVDDIEEMLLVPIDRVDRTQPFKLTIYFKTEGTPSASLDYITHIHKKICHLDIHVGLFYHSEDAACVGYVDSVRAHQSALSALLRADDRARARGSVRARGMFRSAHVPSVRDARVAEDAVRGKSLRGDS